MASKNFPGPSINKLIDKDPQIVKVNMDKVEWGTRPSIFSHMNADPVGDTPGQPSAPEFSIKHVGSK